MPVLTYAQMEGYWIKAGGPAGVAPVAAAIGEAESGGNTDAVNKTDNYGKQSSFGVWQISNGTHTPPSPKWADPAVNAQLAVAKYKGASNTFSDWGTYKTGAYRAYMNGSTTPDLNVTGNPNAIGAELTAATQADCFFGISGIPGTSFWNDIFGSGGNVGQTCFLSRSNVRGIVGAFLVVAGTAGMALSLALIVAIGGKESRLGQQAEQLGLTFAAPEAAAASSAASSAPKRPSNVPQGRHAKTGASAPAAGRHAAP
jgi:hypothetical protein